MDDGDDKFLRKGHPESTPFEYADIEKTTDTGDVTRPANELFRIRTRTGHQILLHNTEDLIYISNSKGSSWIEMSSNGKIDVYAQDSVSVHSENDINFTADRDINLTAMENMNISSGKDLAIDVGGSYGVSAQNEISLNAGANVSLTGQDGVAVYGNSKVTVTSKGSLDVVSQQHLALGSAESVGIEGCSFVKVSTDGDYHMKALGNSYNQVDGQSHSSSGLQTYITAANTLELYSTAAAVKVTAQESMDISSIANTVNVQAKGVLSVKAEGNIQLSSDAQIHLNSPGSPAATAGVSIESRPATLPPAPNPFIPIPPVRANLAARIPEHEPWPQHENINPAAYTPDRTRAGQQQTNSFLQNVLPDTYAAVGTGSQNPAVSSSAEADTNASVASDPAAFPNAASGQYAIIQVGVGDIGNVEKAKQNLREGYANLSAAGYRVVVIAPNINPAFGHPLENDLRILGNAINATGTELGAIVENPKYTQEDPLIIDPDAAQEIADKYRSTAVYYGDTVAQTVAGLSGATANSASSTQAISEQSADVANASLQQDYPAAGTEGGAYGCSGPSDGPLSAAPAGVIDGFNSAETVAYLNALGFRESGLKYNCTNSIGFAGKYQFGGYALKEGGYIKMSARGGGTGLRLNPNNYTGKDGINNVEDWLANKNDCQEKAMILYTNANLRYCKSNGAIKDGDSVSLVAGILMGAHLKGPNDARKWRQGNSVGTDGYGTKIDEYVALGRATVSNNGRFTA